jgi:hypothetical protein
MNAPSPIKNLTPIQSFTIKRPRFALVLALLLASVSAAWSQGQLASGTISGSGAGPFNYSLTFSDAASATSPIGSVWYAWVPGQFYLPTTPSSASAPNGWTANISGNSVQFIANSAANDIAPGHSLSGFGYQASFSPSQLAAAPNSGVSVAYSGGLFSDAGNTFTVQAVAVPEPSSLTLMLCGSAAFLMAMGRCSRLYSLPRPLGRECNPASLQGSRRPR